MNTEPLKDLGFTESEIEVYLTLVREGQMSVGQIAEESGVHRTNIYIILNKLENAGLVSHFFDENKKKFKATNPENLLNCLRETEYGIREMIPELAKIRRDIHDPVGVYFFKGKDGMKSALRDLVRDKKDIFAIGLSGQARNKMPEFQIQSMREIRKQGIKTKCIYIEGIRPAEFGTFEVKYLPKEFISPVYTWIYGDKVVFNIWEPSMTAIMIKSKEVADDYRKYFSLLWKIAKTIKKRAR